MSNYDIAIIGGGPGGYVAAIKSAQLGFKTALIEKTQIGGTCLNIGCIPTKTLVKNAEIIHEVKHAASRGLNIGQVEVDMTKVIKMKNKVVTQLTRGVLGLLRGNGVDLIKGKAEVLSENTLVVEDKEITFKHLIIATGSSNFVPPIPGLDEEGILTSTEILEMKEVPEKLVIIGGGVIGCEFASVFNNFGSKVTIVEMMSKLVPLMDEDVSKTLKNSLISEGVEVMTDCRVISVKKESEKYLVTVNTGTEDVVIETDKVLISVGRRSNLDGLEKLSLKLDRRKYIEVNKKLETNIKNVYAIGDVTGEIQLAHVASAQGLKVVENIAGQKVEMSYDVVPSCIFTIPEIGSVGLTESQAKEKYGEVIVGKFPMMASGKAMAMGNVTGFTKIIADKTSKKVVGCHIIGPSATEIIAVVASVINSDGTLEDIKNTIYAHPTISETIVEATHMALDEPIHMMK